MMEKPAWGRQERRDLPIWEKQIAVLVGYPRDDQFSTIEPFPDYPADKECAESHQCA